MNRTPAERSPQERIDELLKHNTLLMQDARDAAQAAATMEWKVKFWQSQCEDKARQLETANAEIERLNLKVAGAMPSLFDYAS